MLPKEIFTEIVDYATYDRATYASLLLTSKEMYAITIPRRKNVLMTFDSTREAVRWSHGFDHIIILDHVGEKLTMKHARTLIILNSDGKLILHCNPDKLEYLCARASFFAIRVLPDLNKFVNLRVLILESRADKLVITSAFSRLQILAIDSIGQLIFNYWPPKLFGVNVSRIGENSIIKVNVEQTHDLIYWAVPTKVNKFIMANYVRMNISWDDLKLFGPAGTYYRSGCKSPNLDIQYDRLNHATFGAMSATINHTCRRIPHIDKIHFDPHDFYHIKFALKDDPVTRLKKQVNKFNNKMGTKYTLR